MDAFFSEADLIHSYSRREALEDGVLVDVSEAAREVGIRFPVAMTAAAYAATVTWTRETPHQDERGRLHDVVWMLLCAIRGSKGNLINYRLLVVSNKHGGRARPVALKALCGPGDNMKAVVTIMLPEED